MGEPDVLSALNQDFRDLLLAFCAHDVEFLVVGAYALAVHGHARATADIDVFVRSSAGNSERVIAALRAFGAPLSAHGITAADFAKAGTVYQIGQPPRRIDILTAITGVTFDEAWSTRTIVEFGAHAVAFLGRDALIRNKRAAGRPKDIADATALERGDHV